MPDLTAPIKCVIWDLDETLWRGTLLEGDAPRWREDALVLIQLLDARGVLQSIASRNVHAQALRALRERGVDHLFLHPQIHHGAKSASVHAIAQTLGVSHDAVLFIDDQPFEREEVRSRSPRVRCLDAADLRCLRDAPGLRSAGTEEARGRRQRYREEAARVAEQARFTGPLPDFLQGLGLVMTLRAPTRDDLTRAAELTHRTHQLNTTGLTFDLATLDAMRHDPTRVLLIAHLRDRLGDYGRVGLAVLSVSPERWTIDLLLMSCRVLNRDVGGVMLAFILDRAAISGVSLFARLRPTERNRPMRVAYRLAGFSLVDTDGDLQTLRWRGPPSPTLPPHVRLVADGVLDKGVGELGEGDP